MNNWKYKYSKIAAFIFIFLFVAKEVLMVNSIPWAALLLIYILFIASLGIMFMAYIKYHYINNNTKLLYVTLPFLSSTLLYFIFEYITYINLISSSQVTIVSINLIMAITTLLWSLFHAAKGRIYKHSLYLLGVIGILLAGTYLVPVFSYLRFPMFILFYLLFTRPFYPKKEKKADLLGR